MNSSHPTQYQLADIFTKPLDEPTFKRLIVELDKPVVFKAPKTSSKDESVSQGTKPGAKTIHKKPLTSSKQPSVSSKEATKGGSSKFASGNDASAASTAEADPGNSAPSTDPHVFADQTKSVSEGLETILTQPITGKGASSVASQIKEETSSTIKLEDLAKLVSHVQPSFKDLDSPKADPVIIVDDSDKDEDDEVHELKMSQMHKLEAKKNKVEAEAALLKTQTSFPNVEQLKELLVASLQAKLNTLDALPDQSVPLAGQADTISAEGEKNTNQATIS
ncbi:hypothetical protein Tco_0633189 [Tanacetum coccineum]